MMDIEILVRADSAISSYGIAENDMYQDQSLREESSWKYSRRKIIRNLIMVSICSTFVQSVRKESSQNQESMEILQFAQKEFPGLKIDQIFASIINFFLIFLNSIAIPQITISKLSSKYAILISLVSYFVSTAANLFNSGLFTFFALLLNQIFGNLIFIGALVYVKQISTIYSRHSYESDLKIFFLFYLSFFSFNLTSYFWSKLIYCEILTLIKSWVTLNLCIMFMLVMVFILSASLMDNYVDLQERQLKYLLVNWIHLKDKQQLLIIPITFYLGGLRAFFEKNLKISIENSVDEVQSACIICLFSLAGLAAFVIFSRFLRLNLLSILAILFNFLTLIFIFVLKDYDIIHHLVSHFKIYSSLLTIELTLLEINVCVFYAYLFMRSSSISFSNYFYWKSIGSLIFGLVNIFLLNELFFLFASLTFGFLFFLFLLFKLNEYV